MWNKKRHSKIPRARRRNHVPAASLDGDFSSESKSLKCTFRVIAYSPEKVQEKEGADLSQVYPVDGSWPVTWIDVEGLGKPEPIEKVAATFNLHPLVVEDILTAHQRAKLEQYGP